MGRRVSKGELQFPIIASLFTFYHTSIKNKNKNKNKSTPTIHLALCHVKTVDNITKNTRFLWDVLASDISDMAHKDVSVGVAVIPKK